MTVGIPHPEVAETLYVDECVVRVGCPQCKVAAGTPCKGARFEWLAQGHRRGFRYVQYHHVARSDLHRDWKRSGSPARLPARVSATYTTTHGKFPHRIDRNAKTPRKPPKIKRKSKASAAKKSSPPRVWKRPLPRGAKKQLDVMGKPMAIVLRHGLTWEGYPPTDDNLMYWTTRRIYADTFEFMTIWEHIAPYPKIELSFRGDHHELASVEEGFALAPLLLVRKQLLELLQERGLWRIAELERRFGSELAQGRRG